MVAFRRELRAATFGLALLMAFPWLLALSPRDPSANTSSVCTQAQLDEATHHLHLSGRASDSIPLDYLTLSFVISAAESDDTCPRAFDLAASPIHGFAITAESTTVPLTITVERLPRPFAEQLRLRC